MTQANGYLGKREFHGALAKHSPYYRPSVLCVVCGERYFSTCEILGELCHRCFQRGWREADNDTPVY
jgi:hypothetical protein